MQINAGRISLPDVLCLFCTGLR